MDFTITFQKIRELLLNNEIIDAHELNGNFGTKDLEESLRDILANDYQTLIQNNIYRNNFLNVVTYFYVKNERNKFTHKRDETLFDEDLIGKIKQLNAINNSSLYR